MKQINYQALELQLKSKQPTWLFIIFIYVLMQFGLNSIANSLGILYPNISKILYNDTSLIFWFIANSILIFFVVFLTAHHYKSALFSGINKINIKNIILVGLICSLPLLLYYFINFIDFTYKINKFIVLVTAQQPPQSEIKAIISEMHNTIWAPLGFGVTTTGIILSSLWSFTFPIYEECLFTGILFNKIANKFKLPFAIFIFCFVFAFLHFHKTGFGFDLLLIFLFGLSSIASRLISGCWLSSLITHWLLNFMIFAPKWSFALATIKYNL